MEEDFTNSLEEDYSGCTWGNASLDISFPHWLSSYEETLDFEFDIVNSSIPLNHHSYVPGTPEVTVLKSNIVSNDATDDNCSTMSEICNCILCKEPTFIVLPKSVEVCNMELVEDRSVFTIVNNQFTPGPFFSRAQEINCHKSVVSPARKVNKHIKERYNLPKVDPSPNPKWHMSTNTPLDNVCYLLSLFIDVIPKDLSRIWSQIIRRDVTRPERFGITALTSSEMMKLRSEFVKKSDSLHNQHTCKSKSLVSTCMTSSFSNNFSLPHVPVIVNQIHSTNLITELGMLDTGSQISIINLSYVKGHKFIDSNDIVPMTQNCSLKSATGKSYNPFSGKIILQLRFIDKFKRTTRQFSVDFHVLSKENELTCLLLGLNFLMPYVHEICLGKYLIKILINKSLHIIPLYNERQKLVFKAKEHFKAGIGIITCYPSTFICAEKVYNVPPKYQNLLGMSKIVLNPGTIRKNSVKSAYKQAFVFEISAKQSYPMHSEVFVLHDISYDRDIQEYKKSLDNSTGGPSTNLARFDHRFDQLFAPKSRRQNNIGSASPKSQTAKYNKFKEKYSPLKLPNSHHHKGHAELPQRPSSLHANFDRTSFQPFLNSAVANYSSTLSDESLKVIKGNGSTKNQISYLETDLQCETYWPTNYDKHVGLCGMTQEHVQGFEHQLPQQQVLDSQLPLEQKPEHQLPQLQELVPQRPPDQKPEQLPPVQKLRQQLPLVDYCSFPQKLGHARSVHNESILNKEHSFQTEPLPRGPPPKHMEQPLDHQSPNLVHQSVHLDHQGPLPDRHSPQNQHSPPLELQPPLQEHYPPRLMHQQDWAVSQCGISNSPGSSDVEILGFGRKLEKFPYLSNFPEALLCKDEDLQPNSKVLSPHCGRFTVMEKNKKSYKSNEIAYHKSKKVGQASFMRSEEKLAPIVASASTPKETVRDLVNQLPPPTPETAISDQCLKQHVLREDISLHPNRGGLAKM